VAGKNSPDGFSDPPPTASPHSRAKSPKRSLTELDRSRWQLAQQLVVACIWRKQAQAKERRDGPVQRAYINKKMNDYFRFPAIRGLCVHSC
jgi:hypothetical protein